MRTFPESKCVAAVRCELEALQGCQTSQASFEVTCLLPAASNQRDLVVAVRPGTGPSGARDSATKGGARCRNEAGHLERRPPPTPLPLKARRSRKQNLFFAPRRCLSGRQIKTRPAAKAIRARYDVVSRRNYWLSVTPLPIGLLRYPYSAYTTRPRPAHRKNVSCVRNGSENIRNAQPAIANGATTHTAGARNGR